MDEEKKLNRNVILTGITSFFTDISSEMIYPLYQAFINSVLKNQALFLGPILGIIEGIAESTASLLKVFSGYYSDKWENRKKPAIAGYSLSAISKLLFLLPIWYTILLGRFFDRVGKGIRTAPRDAIITESTPKEMQGKAFGFQRAMDFAGAFGGTILAYILVTFIYKNKDISEPAYFYPIFLISLIPAFLGVVSLFFIKEIKKQNTNSFKKEKPKPNLDIRKYDKNLQLFFISQFIFTLGNSSNQFLLLRSSKLGYSLSGVLLMYIIFNLTTSIFSTHFGKLSDRIGRKKLLMAGYFIYSMVYMAFGFINESNNKLLWIFWPIYGIYYAMTEGVEKAFVSDLAPKDSKATALGFYNTIVGIGLLPASLIAGFLFYFSSSAPFIFGGIMAIITVLLLFMFVKEKI